MRSELLRVHRATGATSVYVTHDQVEATTMATHVAVLREGRVEQFGSPAELLAAPATPFVAGFLGTPPANLVPCDGGLAMYRPDRVAVSLEPGPGRLPVEFAEAVLLAGRVVVTGRWQGRRLSAVTGALPPVAVGERLWFVLPPQPDAVFAGADDGTPA